jgi:cytochrome b
MNKSYIWPIPIRIFHWLLVFGFICAYSLGDADELKNLHFAFGAFVGALLIFRIVFGFIGHKYANFRDFPISLRHQKEFFKTIFSREKAYAGHNPAASLVMISIIFTGVFCSISGYLFYVTKNNILSGGMNKEFIKELHEISANLFLLLVAIHLLGILIDTIWHRKNKTLNSIFTGYKNIEAPNSQYTGIQKAFSLIWLIIPFVAFYITLSFAEKEQVEQNNSGYYEDEDCD